MHHVVMMSGGVGSWYTAFRVVQTKIRPGDDLALIFADVKMEDEDLYRFLREATQHILDSLPDGATGRLVQLADGRDPWQVFFDVRFLGNSRVDPCSKLLKRDLIRKYVNENFPADETIIYLGIDWTEEHRFQKAKPYWRPYRVEAPLCEPPYVDRDEMFSELERVGIVAPRLYALGMAHNNCGGFCVKGGMAAFRTLMRTMPDRYAYHERKEQELREYLGKDVTILVDRSRKIIMRRLGLSDCDVEKVDNEWRIRATGEKLPTKLPLTLREFRERVEAGGDDGVDPLDIGGCACFTPDNYESDLKQSNVVDLPMPRRRVHPLEEPA